MILIFGCGILGQYLLKEVLQNTDEQVLCTYHTQKPQLSCTAGDRVCFQKCDVTSEADLQALSALCAGDRLRVFYCTAYHNIDAVYAHPQQAQKVNVEGLARFLEIVKNIEALYFISTDCVYGESRPDSKPFRETAACAPINAYGRQKLAAEQLVLNRGYHVLRCSLLYGASLDDNRKTFYDKTFAALKAGERVEMIDGLARCALTYSEAAHIIMRLVTEKKELPPVLNICGDSLITKYELGLRIAAAAGASPAQVVKISKEEGNKFFQDKRADVIALDSALLHSVECNLNA
ncbi:MAG: sugar nucleotide-binding protein [Clostridia bacterium]|nr:sugar nucleotide-binding protein [Clostridia bacterium]